MSERFLTIVTHEGRRRVVEVRVEYEMLCGDSDNGPAEYDATVAAIKAEDGEDLTDILDADLENELLWQADSSRGRPTKAELDAVRAEEAAALEAERESFAMDELLGLIDDGALDEDLAEAHALAELDFVAETAAA
jgi:hypothetical protein